MPAWGVFAGDIGAKFAWDTKALGKHFSLTPSTGFLAAAQIAKIGVTLHPRSEAPDIRANGVKCTVQGLKAPLALTLTGAAVADSEVAGTLKFACAVRQCTVQSITLTNPTPHEWHLSPTVQNACWSGAELTSVPANGKADYKLEFRPLVMAASDKPHTGSAFFPLPNGTGLLYRLEGVAEKPAPVDTIKRCAAALLC
jgi:hydrocephalus-inducing protein